MIHVIRPFSLASFVSKVYATFTAAEKKNGIRCQSRFTLYYFIIFRSFVLHNYGYGMAVSWPNKFPLLITTAVFKEKVLIVYSPMRAARIRFVVHTVIWHSDMIYNNGQNRQTFPKPFRIKMLLI